MNSKKTKQMVTGAFMAALFGVLGLINLYTGSLFDIVIIYIMCVALAVYAYMYTVQAAILVWIAGTIVIFMTGNLFFTFYAGFSMPLGILYIYLLKYPVKISKYILIAFSFLKDLLVLGLIGSLFGIDYYSETKEIYLWIVEYLPFLKGFIVQFIIQFGFCLVIAWCEAFVIRVYTNFVLYRMKKK